MKKLPPAYIVNMEYFCHINIYHLKVGDKFSKFNHNVNQNTESLTLTPTSFLKETCSACSELIVNSTLTARVGVYTETNWGLTHATIGWRSANS